LLIDKKLRRPDMNMKAKSSFHDVMMELLKQMIGAESSTGNQFFLDALFVIETILLQTKLHADDCVRQKLAQAYEKARKAVSPSSLPSERSMMVTGQLITPDETVTTSIDQSIELILIQIREMTENKRVIALRIIEDIIFQTYLLDVPDIMTAYKMSCEVVYPKGPPSRSINLFDRSSTGVHFDQSPLL
jgi:hypothetical protein